MLTPLQIFRRVRAWLRFDRFDREMDEEIRLHLELEAGEGIRAGLSPSEAARQARVNFGGVQRYREEGHEARGGLGLHDLMSDLRYAGRILRRTPVFTAVAVATLGLGVGANTAIFSVVNTVLLRPLPYHRPDALVSVWDGGHSRAEFTRIRDRSRTLESVTAFLPNYGMSLSGDGEPERIVTALVSSEFFSVFGVAPTVGRFFHPGEDAANAEPVVVLGFGLWRDRFGSDPRIIGRSIDLDGITWTVIGVAPRGFSFPGPDTRLWAPLVLNEAQPGPFWGAYGNQFVGRLRPEATRDQLRAELLTIAAALRLENPVWRPAENYTDGIQVTALQDHLVHNSRRFLGVLLGAVGLVLLIACANVANLLLVRGAARERELAIRGTLGAGPSRLARQLLVECGLLALLGGATALVLAGAGTRALLRLLPQSTPRLAEVSVDGAALGFTALLTIVTALLFGLGPALHLARADSGAALAGGHATVGTHPRRMANALVSAQIALAVILAVAAGLLVRSLVRLLDVDPGFQPVSIVSAKVSPPKARYDDANMQRTFYSQLLERLHGTAGITATGITSQLPFDQVSEIMAMWIDGWTTDPNRLDVFELRRVSPDYFRTLGIALRQGRIFTDGDRAGTEPVAIVSEGAASRFWSGRVAVGGRMRFPWPGWMTVVGVVADVKNNDLTGTASPAIYIPFDQDPQAAMTVVVRSAGEPSQAIDGIRAAVATLARDVPVSDEHTMQRLIERSVAAPRSASVLLLGFGTLALLLGAVGTYGLVAYGVERRTREIAVRMAVGAHRNAVIRMIVGEGVRLAGVGILVGLVAALALSRFMRGLLYEIQPNDVVAFTIAPAVLVMTALLACLVPAVRASRIEPASALKRE